jgi:hypothetical protein
MRQKRGGTAAAFDGRLAVPGGTGLGVTGRGPSRAACASAPLSVVASGAVASEAAASVAAPSAAVPSGAAPSGDDASGPELVLLLHAPTKSALAAQAKDAKKRLGCLTGFLHERTA